MQMTGTKPLCISDLLNHSTSFACISNTKTQRGKRLNNLFIQDHSNKKEVEMRIKASQL